MLITVHKLKKFYCFDKTRVTLPMRIQFMVDFSFIVQDIYHRRQLFFANFNFLQITSGVLFYTSGGRPLCYTEHILIIVYDYKRRVTTFLIIVSHFKRYKFTKLPIPHLVQYIIKCTRLANKRFNVNVTPCYIIIIIDAIIEARRYKFTQLLTFSVYRQIRNNINHIRQHNEFTVNWI